MAVHAWWLSSLVLASLLISIECLTCLSCSGSAIPRDCPAVVHCGAHEACYLDSYVTATGHLRYNMGCRDTQGCGHTLPVGRRSAESAQERSSIHQGDTKICSECCASGLCNARGCGQTGFPALPNRGPICYACVQHIGIGTCNNVQVCSRSEVCEIKLTSGPGISDIFYESMCRAKQVPCMPLRVCYYCTDEYEGCSINNVICTFIHII